MRSPRTWFLIATCVLLPWHIAIVARDPWFRLPPKPVGDGPDYENIAYHLSQGAGWSLDWTDPNWRAPYNSAEGQLPSEITVGHSQQNADEAGATATGQDADREGAYAVQLSRHDGLAPTTGRPPLFPALVAMIYWIVERGPAAFAGVRLLLASCLAFAGALATAFAARIVGSMTSKTWPVVLAASGTLLLALLDRTVRTYATDFLTEPLALLLMQLWLWCICELLGVFRSGNRPDSQEASNSRRYALATLSGILLALLIYTRSVVVLWLPGIWLLIWTSGWFHDAAKVGQVPRKSLALATHVVIVCVMVCAPWWIRNCWVLESWMPLGTQGPITLVGGYSDEALLHNGEWQIEPEQRLRAWAEYDLAVEEGNSIPRREARIARQASREVRNWAGQHVADLPRLALMRVVNEWNPYTGRALAWKLMALVGLIWLVTRAPRIAWILGGVLVLNTLCVMALYSVGGRFLVPLYGVLYTLAGLGITCAVFPMLIFNAEDAERGRRTRTKNSSLGSTKS